MMPTTLRRTQLLSVDVICKTTHDRCQVHGAETQVGAKRPRQTSPWVSVQGTSLGASSGTGQPDSPLSGKPLSSYSKLLHLGRNRAGLGPLCGTSPTPTRRLQQNLSKAQPAKFRAAVVWPRLPHPTSCKSLSQQAQKIRGAVLGWGKEKPQQLPPNWHSQQLEASKCRNELNNLFFPLQGGVQAPGPHPSHTLAAAIYKI